jgi:cyclin-dependent kinase regulatory subunit CKS1
MQCVIGVVQNPFMSDISPPSRLIREGISWTRSELRSQTRSIKKNSEPMYSEEPPLLTPEVLPSLSNDYDVIVGLPGLTVPGLSDIDISQDTSSPDLINYSDVYSDDWFDYRSVELPISLVQYLPSRNFCESEWRSFGVCMSAGWENYDRRSCELHVLWFRRPLASTTSAKLLSIWRAELDAEEKQRENPSFIEKLGKVFIFPMFSFSSSFKNKSFSASSDSVLNFHKSVLDFAKKFLEISEASAGA